MSLPEAPQGENAPRHVWHAPCFLVLVKGKRANNLKEIIMKGNIENNEANIDDSPVEKITDEELLQDVAGGQGAGDLRPTLVTCSMLTCRAQQC
ncbi:MAG: hypothetical protein PHV34_18900 [Verrucomicrobiae bacterium]|nr:hypothetical protein [Verrucomicrobiae bacterium]